MKIWTLVRAEIAARFHTPAFLITAAAMLVLGTLLLPPPGAPYTTITYANRPGLLVGGFAGTVCGILMTILFGLPAFFVAGDSLKRDRRNGFGRLLATLPVSRTAIVQSRALAAFAALTLVALAVGMLLAVEGSIRSGGAFAPLAFLAHYLPIVIPGLAVIAALATIVDAFAPVTPGPRVALGLSVWLALVLMSAVPAIGAFDPDAIRPLRDDAAHAFSALSGGWSIGFVSVNAAAPPLRWDGIALDAGFLAARTALLAGSFVAVALAALGFDRFAVIAKQRFATISAIAHPMRMPRPAMFSHAPKVGLRARIEADLRYGVGAHRRTSLVALVIAVIAACLALGSPQLGKIVLLFDALLIARILGIGEVGVPGDRLLQTIAGCSRAWIFWKACDVATATVFLALPFLAIETLREGPLAAAALIVAIVFVAALIATCARVARGPILGTVLSFVWWYTCVLNAPPLGADLAGIGGAPSVAALIVAVVAIVAMTGSERYSAP